MGFLEGILHSQMGSIERKTFSHHSRLIKLSVGSQRQPDDITTDLYRE
jgi:hypothetical protein